MRSLAFCFFLAIAGCAAAPAPQVGQVGSARSRSLAELAGRATTGPDVATELRKAGPAGLEALLATYDAEPEGPRKHALAAAVDHVAAQRDATASRLYWFTDFDQARAAARASGRPILSLRLLGRLDEELSCANSRFFRTALYPDPHVNQVLRHRFVLYWSSERPAPVATIDFGDGRKIVRTVTGNSIHYVLDAEGRPVDAIPGLYGPAAFARALDVGADLAEAVAGLDGARRDEELGRRHRLAVDELRARWSIEAPPAAVAGNGPPSAVMAMPRAIGKAAVEAPMVRGLLPGEPGVPDPGAGEWAEMARRHAGEARLSPPALALIRKKNPRDWRRGEPAPLDDAGFAVLVERFEEAMVADTLRNEIIFHATIRRWLTEDPRQDFATLNRRVYQELFLTPRTDPWLGLVPPASFSGIEDDGLVR
jgi:hypothetical protein